MVLCLDVSLLTVDVLGEGLLGMGNLKCLYRFMLGAGYNVWQDSSL